MTASHGHDRFRLFLVLPALYVAQGIPTHLLLTAMPPIMREQGVSRTVLGILVSAVLLAPAARLLWAPTIDHLRPLGFGHRAGWVTITLGGTVLSTLR